MKTMLFIWCALALQIVRFDARGATDADMQPGPLLKESFRLAKARTDKGATPVLAVLRLGITMRMAGMKEDALAVFEHALTMCAAMSDEEVRDEIRVELCRELVLAGAGVRARELPALCSFRESELVAWLFIAEAAWSLGDEKQAERAMEDALKRIEADKPALGRMGLPVLCSLSRLCRGMNKPELIQQCLSLANQSLWKSAMLTDEVESLVEKGQAEEATRLLAGVDDQHMRVLAHARVAALMFRRGKPVAPELAALLKAAMRIKASDARDFALRTASGKLATAGDVESALKLAEEIQEPRLRLLAKMPLVAADKFEPMLAELKTAAEADRPLLAEVLVQACGVKELPEQALTASGQLTGGWPKVRALADAAQHLKKDAAKRLLDAAEHELDAIKDAGWHCHALMQLSLSAHRAGCTSEADKAITLACAEALHLEAPEAAAYALPQVIEAALLTRHQALALQTLTTALSRKPSASLRDALVPMLIDAGGADLALAECEKSRLTDDFAKRFVAYRLAKAGRVADAVRYVASLNARAQAEALADVALAQLPPPKPVQVRSKVTGMSVHGGWTTWVARLERMGRPWEIMPFSMPYTAGPAGLAAKYSMLGFPGTGDHQYQVSAAGDDHLRDYLHGGGGLFGICAGQLFASGHPTGHKFVPTDYYYMRGQGAHQVQVPRAHPVALTLPNEMIITRRNGDFLLPRIGCDVIGWYDRQNVCAAVVAANYGWGRVVVSSPHPESGSDYEPTDRLCVAATLWILDEMP